jgi:hypothetical protein
MCWCLVRLPWWLNDLLHTSHLNGRRTIFEWIKEKWNMWIGLNWPREGSIGRFWEHGDESFREFLTGSITVSLSLKGYYGVIINPRFGLISEQNSCHKHASFHPVLHVILK